MEFNFSEMEKNIGDLFSTFNESLDMIDTEIERFEIKRNQFEMKHGLDKEEGLSPKGDWITRKDI